MEINNIKCSQKQHNESEAISYCQQCEIYMCDKCEKIHSELCQNHIPYNLNKGKANTFTGICKTGNHTYKLEYFCKTHNELCCAACITKIKGNGNGQHTDCDVCYIIEIKEEKKNKLKENIQHLENLSNTIENSINELKKIFEKINEDKENINLNVQKIFTKIRNEINEREDKILLEIEQKYDEIYFKEEFVKESEKLPNKIKESLKQGKLINAEWNENILNSLINDCINIENDINNIKIITQNVEKCSKLNSEIKFTPEENNKDYNELINTIKNFGLIYINNDDKKENDIESAKNLRSISYTESEDDRADSIDESDDSIDERDESRDGRDLC